MPNPIFEPLSRYLSIEKPDYACMINGKWGSGKTYFLLEELNSLLKNNDKDEIQELKIRYVSANGVKDFDEILDELKRQKILPQTNSKVKLVGKLAGRVIDNLPVGLIANVIAPGSGQAADKLANGAKGMFEPKDISAIVNAVSFNEKDIIIIDDLERVHKDCDLIGLIGEINTEFVEHHNIKTILVCDESEIIRRFSAGDNDRKLKGTIGAYKASKEKCVRHTYLFENQLKPLLIEFIKSETQINDDTKIFLEEQDNVNTLYYRLEEFKDHSGEKEPSNSTHIQNLRVIKHIILSLGQVIDSIVDNNHKVFIFNDLCHFIIGQTLYFKYADHSGSPIEISNHVKMLSAFNPVDLDQAKLRDTITQWLINKYNLESFEVSKFESAAIRDLIFKGVYDKNNIEVEIGSQVKSLGLDSPENADLQRFTHYRELEDSVFINLVDCIDNHLCNNKFNLTQTVSLITTLRQLITKGYMLPKFKSHKDVSDYFIKYINEEKTKSINNFMTITDIKKEANNLKEKEYTPLKEKIEQLCEVRNISLDVEGIGIEVTEICLLSREFEERHLRILLNRMSQSDIDKIQSHYTFSNQFKRRFNNIVDNSKDWLTVQNLNDLKMFCSQSLTQLDQQSIGKLKVIDMIKVIDQFIKEKNDTSKLPANST